MRFFFAAHIRPQRALLGAGAVEKWMVPDEQVVEVVEFETSDPALQGEMMITITLTDSNGGKEIHAVHDGLPLGLPPADSEVGWRSSLAKLAALVEASA